MRCIGGGGDGKQLSSLSEQPLACEQSILIIKDPNPHLTVLESFAWRLFRLVSFALLAEASKASQLGYSSS